MTGTQLAAIITVFSGTILAALLLRSCADVRAEPPPPPVQYDCTHVPVEIVEKAFETCVYSLEVEDLEAGERCVTIAQSLHCTVLQPPRRTP